MYKYSAHAARNDSVSLGTPCCCWASYSIPLLAAGGSVIAASHHSVAAGRATSLPCSRRGTDSSALVTHFHRARCLCSPVSSQTEPPLHTEVKSFLQASSFPCSPQGSVIAALHHSSVAAGRGTSLPCARRGTDSAVLVTYFHRARCLCSPVSSQAVPLLHHTETKSFLQATLFPCSQQGSVMAALLSQLAARRATSLPCSRRGTDSAVLVTHFHRARCLCSPVSS